MNQIHGVVRTTSPLHVSAFDDSPSNKERNVKSMMQQYVFEGDIRRRVPYFPANDFRGRLRRKAARHVLLALEQKGLQVSRPLYSALMSSAVTESIGENRSLEELQRARRNLYMGVFGGGARMIESRYRPSDMVPILPATIGAGLVPSEYGGIDLRYYNSRDNRDVHIEHGYELLNVYYMTRRDDVLELVAMDDLLRFVEDAESSITEYQAEILQGRQDRKAAKKKAAAGEEVDAQALKKRDVQNIYGFEAICPGVPMYFNLCFEDLTEAQVGLLLVAVRDLFAEPIGGVVRAGMGRTNPRGLSLEYNDEHYPVFDDDEGDLRLAEEVQPFVAAMEEALRDVDAEELFSYFVPTKEAKKLLNAA